MVWGLLQQLGQLVLAWLHYATDHEVAVAAGAMGAVRKFLAPGMTLVLASSPALQTHIWATRSTLETGKKLEIGEIVCLVLAPLRVDYSQSDLFSIATRSTMLQQKLEAMSATVVHWVDPKLHRQILAVSKKVEHQNHQQITEMIGAVWKKGRLLKQQPWQEVPYARGTAHLEVGRLSTLSTVELVSMMKTTCDRMRSPMEWKKGWARLVWLASWSTHLENARIRRKTHAQRLFASMILRKSVWLERIVPVANLLGMVHLQDEPGLRRLTILRVTLREWRHH
jgi:hypothetical protein